MTALISEPTIAATAPKPDGAASTGLLPARRLALQAHALRAAAVFLEHDGIANLTITVDFDRIDIQVPDSLGTLPARTVAMHLLADACDAATRSMTGAGHSFFVADGDLAGHKVHIFTAGDEQR